MRRDAETGQRGFLITGEERYLQPYRAALQQVDTDFAGLDEAIRPWDPGGAASNPPPVHTLLKQRKLDEPGANRRLAPAGRF